MKILAGTLKETIYRWPSEIEVKPLEVAGESQYYENEVAYIHDKIGLHRIGNPSTEMAVSLHLYTPPWAAKFGCSVFDEYTGKASHVKMEKL